MDIACPNCAATYRVPDTLLAGGKALRCAACDHEWVPEVPQAAPAPAPIPAPPPPKEEESVTPPPEPAPVVPVAGRPTPPPESPPAPAEVTKPPRPAPPTSPPPLQRRGGALPVPSGRPPSLPARSLPIAWAASVALVVLALLGLFVFAEEIALAWPPFARVTALLDG